MLKSRMLLIGLLMCSCGGEPLDSAATIERTASNLAAIYNTPVPLPGLYSLPPTTGFAYNTGWPTDYLAGWVNEQAAEDGIYRTRPNVGYPSRVANLNYFHPTETVQSPPTFQMAPVERDGFNYVSGDHLGLRQVFICSWDKRFPWLPNSSFQNKWCSQIPLRNRGNAAPTQLDGYIFYVKDQSNMSVYSGQSDKSSHINDGINQISSLMLDYYGRCELCSGANMTGFCKWFGYNCPDAATCHNSDVGGQVDFADIRYATGDVNGNPNPHQSFKCEFGFSAPVHGVPLDMYLP